MKIFLTLAASLVIVSAAILSVRTHAAAPSQPNVSILSSETEWTQVNAKRYYVSGDLSFLCAAPRSEDLSRERQQTPHADAFITVYVNSIGRKSMFSSRSSVFPEGSVIVKQKFDSPSASAPALYTIMTKRSPGYNPKVGDWEFSVVSGDGQKVEATGKLENCMTCHEPRHGTDFVFRSYLTTTQ